MNTEPMNIDHLGQLLQKLLEKLETLDKSDAPLLPLAVQLWDFKAIGAYLKRTPKTVRDDIAVLPDFPKPIRLPSPKPRSARPHALYKAREVITWAESHTARY